jgi:membrane-anchored glycerophosphoryl diester phosphodiesterase (GDPDase)
MQKLIVGECIRFGWETFKKRPWMLIGAFVVAMLVSGISSALLDPGEGAPLTATTVVMGLVSGIIGLMVEIGLVTFSLRAHDAVESVGVKDLWNPKPFIWYLLGQIVVGVIVLVGLVLLIIPGVIAALGLMFSSYLIVDKGRGPIEALKESWAMTKGHKWELLLLTATLLGLNILGLLALVVGLLVTVPVSMLAVVHAYRKLSGASPVTPVPTA